MIFRRLAGPSLLLAQVLLTTFSLPAQDTVLVYDETGTVVHRYPGEIVQWSADRLTMVSSGREREVPARRVVAVEYARTAAQLEGDQFFDERRFDQAALRYENALQVEARPWVIEELRARRLRCAAAAGDLHREIAEFLALGQLNSNSRFFHLIPLAWHPAERTSGPLAGELQNWLQAADPVRSLIAASWLLTADSETAGARLKELAASDDPRIAQLADAQTWRPRLIASGQPELNRWRLAIERMPEPLQSGPRLLAAMLQKQMAATDQAAIALLQIPILYGEQYQLCGAALAEAQRVLAAAGRHADADRVARELQQDYGLSRAAARAGTSGNKLD